MEGYCVELILSIDAMLALSIVLTFRTGCHCQILCEAFARVHILNDQTLWFLADPLFSDWIERNELEI